MTKSIKKLRYTKAVKKRRKDGVVQRYWKGRKKTVKGKKMIKQKKRISSVKDFYATHRISLTGEERDLLISLLEHAKEDLSMEDSMEYGGTINDILDKINKIAYKRR